jgi:uncharacterized protein YdhG (YjbR/CyaY superfamily)
MQEAAMASPTTIEAYVARLSDDRRAGINQLREVVRTAAPDATEVIAYNMPAFRSHGGQFLVSFAAFKAHYSLFPASDAVIASLGPEIEPYLAGKGTIRFPAKDPLPLEIVARVVKIRLAENAARGGR